VLLAAFVAFFAATSVWSLATPLMASPDEPVHVAKAAAVVRGEFTGRLIGGPSSPDGVVTIPAAYADLGRLVKCYQFQANRPASCAPAYKASSRTVSMTIYNARYQPLYYVIVGIPSLFTDSSFGIYLMRLLSGALSALFLALAVMAAVTWSRSRLLLAGVVVAATPSVLFFGGVVNPTGFETSVAICLWTSALILARERLKHPPMGLVALVAVSGGIEALVRSMSPFWVVLTLLTALAVAEWGELGSFLRSRRAWLAGAFLVICGALGTAWIVLEHSLNVLPPSAPEPAKVGGIHLLIDGLLRTSQYFTEMVSRFGWLVAPSPDFTYLVWAGLIGLVVLLALATGSPRRCVVLLVLLAAVVVIPVVISVGQAHRLGITWQGKDTLPLAVGVPILAASMLATSTLGSVRIFRSRLVGVAAAAAGLATLVALFGDLRRNAVGDAGPYLSFLHAAWQPPLGIAGVFVFGLAATALLTGLFTVLGIPPAASRTRSRVPRLSAGESSPWALESRDGERLSRSGETETSVQPAEGEGVDHG
jgi:hypothetical protein